MSAILKIISALIVALERIYESRKRKKRQAERDALEDNPDLWFNQHFNGVRDQRPDNADKTDTSNHPK